MQTFQEFSEKLSRSISVKIAIIGFLILILLIPAFMIQELISERQKTRNEVVQEVSDKWGREQTVTGPIISIPYYEQYVTNEQEIIKSPKTLFILPEKLDIDGQINPEIRYRGIYKVIVYNSAIHFNGIFHLPDLNELGIPAEQVYWDKASILLGISDLRGIQKEIKVSVNDQLYDVNPGLKYTTIANAGVTSDIKLNPGVRDYNVQFDLNLSGSENLYFSPVGKTTTVNINSPWSTPSFTGSFLPDDHSVGNNGFKANWTIFDLNRNFPQVWNNQTYNMNDTAFGVNLLFPVDEYQKSMRSAKYAVMFIALTFLIYLFVEIINKKRIHPIQYLLVSLALLLFYTLLLSLSEQIGFNWAYLISAVAIIGLITVYSHSIFKSGKLTRITSMALIVLYAFLFTILQLEDYALLFGSIGLFIILGFVMYLSKRINWYGQINGEGQNKEK
ncbi:MAG: cell envelope integrity protein CreD [Bacteroidales bacterium]|nr:cell envelope integrity protein CreD [Bacteroidales bacterium]